MAAANLTRGPEILSFFVRAPNTITHLVCDPSSNIAATIDSVTNYDYSNGKLSATSANHILSKTHLAGAITLGKAPSATLVTITSTFTMESRKGISSVYVSNAIKH